MLIFRTLRKLTSGSHLRGQVELGQMIATDPPLFIVEVRGKWIPPASTQTSEFDLVLS